MARPKSVAVIHPKFSAAYSGLQADAAGQAQALSGALRPWQVPGDVADLLDVPELDVPFDREDIGANFEQAVASPEMPGTTGDVVALATQSDCLAAAERAFRARHATPVRCLVHALARRRGHGEPSGLHTGGVVQYVQDVLAAAKA